MAHEENRFLRFSFFCMFVAKYNTVEVTESTPATMQEQPGQCTIYYFSRFFYLSCLRFELLLLLS